MTCCCATKKSNIKFKERKNTMNQNETVKNAGQFLAYDKQKTPLIIEWQKTTLFAPEFAKILREIWPMGCISYTAPEIQFLHAYPEVVSTEEYYKPFRPLFKNGFDKVDWSQVEKIMQDLLKSHFIFDTSTWGPEVTAMFAQDVCYAVTARDQQTQNIYGFMSFMLRQCYAPGDIKLAISTIDQAHQNSDLEKLLISSILQINTSINRICTCVRVTNIAALKKYLSWGFVHTDNPILDHPHNFNHWTFLEYKTNQTDVLQKVADELKEVK